MEQDNVNILVLDSARRQKLNLYYARSTLTLDDNPWKLFEVFKLMKPFFEYMRHYKYEEKPSPGESVADKEFYKIYLRADTTSRHYRRETYSLLEYLGDLGGLIDIIFIMCAAFVGTIIDRQFNAAMVGQTFQVQEYTADQTDLYESSKKSKLVRKQTTLGKSGNENKIELTEESSSLNSDDYNKIVPEESSESDSSKSSSESDRLDVNQTAKKLAKIVKKDPYDSGGSGGVTKSPRTKNADFFDVIDVDASGSDHQDEAFIDMNKSFNFKVPVRKTRTLNFARSENLALQRSAKGIKVPRKQSALVVEEINTTKEYRTNVKSAMKQQR